MPRGQTCLLIELLRLQSSCCVLVELRLGLLKSGLHSTSPNVSLLGCQIALTFGFDYGLTGATKSTLLHSAGLIRMALHLRRACSFPQLRCHRLFNVGRHVMFCLLPAKRIRTYALSRTHLVLLKLWPTNAFSTKLPCLVSAGSLESVLKLSCLKRFGRLIRAAKLSGLVLPRRLKLIGELRGVVRRNALVLVLRLVRGVPHIQCTCRSRACQAHTCPNCGRWLQTSGAFKGLILQALESRDLRGVHTSLPRPLAEALVWVSVYVRYRLGKRQLFLRGWFGPFRQINHLGLGAAAASTASTATVNNSPAFFAGHTFAQRFAKRLKLSAGIAHIFTPTILYFSSKP